jgi:hypothetical protein
MEEIEMEVREVKEVKEVQEVKDKNIFRHSRRGGFSVPLLPQRPQLPFPGD